VARVDDRPSPSSAEAPRRVSGRTHVAPRASTALRTRSSSESINNSANDRLLKYDEHRVAILAIVFRREGWAWGGSASVVAVLMLLTACRAGSDYCDQVGNVSSSFDALRYTALLGEGGVRAEFVDRFEAFRGELESLLGELPNEFDDRAAAVQTAVDGMSDELRSSATERTSLSISYARLNLSLGTLIDALDAAC
jgi:hypothetical protein